MNIKTRRANISNSNREDISNYAVRMYPDMQRTALAEKILAEFEWKGKPPQIEVIERLISKFRNYPDTPLDIPFSLGATMEHEIPAEVIPLLLDIRLQKPDFTIRQARWAVKLHVFFTNHPEESGGLNPGMIGHLASIYALHERMWEVTEPNKPLDTSRLDRIYLMHRPGEGNGELIPRIHDIVPEEFTLQTKDNKKKKRRSKRRTE